MSRIDDQRAAVRKLREHLGLSREQFRQLMADRGLTVSTVTIEGYEKEVPTGAANAFARLALEKNLPSLAVELNGGVPVVDPKTSGDSTDKPLALDPSWSIKSQYIERAREIQGRISADVGQLGELLDETELHVDARTVETQGRVLRPVRKRRKGYGTGGA